MITFRYQNIWSFFFAIGLLMGVTPARMQAARELSTVQMIGGLALLGVSYKVYDYVSTYFRLSAIEELLDKRQEIGVPTKFMSWQMQDDEYPTARSIGSRENIQRTISELLVLNDNQRPDFFILVNPDDKKMRCDQIQAAIASEIKELREHKEYLEGIIGLSTNPSNAKLQSYKDYQVLLQNAHQAQGAVTSDLKTWTPDQEARMHARRVVEGRNNEYVDEGQIITYSQNHKFSSQATWAIILWWQCLQRIARLNELSVAHAKFGVVKAPAVRPHEVGRAPHVGVKVEENNQSWLPDMSGWKWKIGGAVATLFAIGFAVEKITRR